MTSENCSQFYFCILNYISEIKSANSKLNNISYRDLPNHQVRRLQKCYNKTLKHLLKISAENHQCVDEIGNTQHDTETSAIIMQLRVENRLHIRTAKKLENLYASQNKDVVHLLKGIVANQKTAKYLLRRLQIHVAEQKPQIKPAAGKPTKQSKIRPYNKTLTMEEKKMLQDTKSHANACYLICGVRYVLFIANALEKQLRRQQCPQADTILKMKRHICSYQGQAKRLIASMFPTSLDVVSKFEIHDFDVKSLVQTLYRQQEICIDVSNSLLSECLLITSNKVILQKCRKLIHIQHFCLNSVNKINDCL